MNQERTGYVDAAFFGISESIADLTLEEADIVLEAIRLCYRLKVGPSTDKDAREVERRLIERMQ